MAALIDNRPILFITPHHVGTWFFLNFLLKHKQINGFCCHTHFEELNKYKNIPYSKIANIEGFKPTAEIISTNAIYTVYHAHTPYDYSEYLHMLVNFVPTFVVIRDPLITIISHVKRYPPGTSKAFSIRGEIINEIDSWKTFIRTMKDSDNIFTIPMDLLSKDSDVRKTNKLTLLLKHLGLEFDNLLVFNTVQDWVLVNSFEYSEKKYYHDKDIQKIEGFIGSLWKELKDLEHEFRPYLENFGYKNLLWWS